MLELNIWGRDLEIEEVYDVYSGEEILQEQRDALREMLSEENVFDSSLEAVKEYCVKHNPVETGGKIENIFRYVVPFGVFVKRDGKIALMCHYKFDMEHGLAVVYERKKLVKVCSQDDIL